MIGIRNNSTRGEIKSGEIWVNELRMHGCDPETVSAAVFQSMANAQSAGFAELNA